MEFLLVDDNEINLELQKLMLEGCGLSVSAVDSGKKAIELAKRKEFFMIFMDIHMPEMDGFETSRQIREFDKSVLIVALSADDISKDNEDYVSSGMNGALKKPLDLHELRELLREYSVSTGNDNGPWKKRTNIIFDYKALISIIRDERIVLQMLEQFFSVHINDCQKLSDYIEKEDYLSARKILHNIIGLSGNLCCRRLYDVSLLLSDQLKKERSDSFIDFADIWEMTISEVSAYSDKLSEKYKPKAVNVDWKSLWKEFTLLCYDFDISAQSLFMKNIKAFMEHINAENFEKLRTAVINYDFLWLEEHLEEFNVSSTVG